MLYQLAGTGALADALPLTGQSLPFFRGVVASNSLTTFDDQSPSNFGYTGQVTLKGYDNMTGLGTPNGQVFINDLRRLEG